MRIHNAPQHPPWTSDGCHKPISVTDNSLYTFFLNKKKQGLGNNQINCSLADINSSSKKVTYLFHALRFFHINFKCYLEKLTN